MLAFDKSCEDLLGLYVNNQVYARGEAVKIGEKFGPVFRGHGDDFGFDGGRDDNRFRAFCCRRTLRETFTRNPFVSRVVDVVDNIQYAVFTGDFECFFQFRSQESLV